MDATLFEDLRFCAKEYVSKCRKRLKRYIPKRNSCFRFCFWSYTISRIFRVFQNFKLRHCVDFSKLAIKKARLKLGKKGKFYCNDFFKIKLKKNYFDCILSLHTIYHIDKKLQAKAINKLITVSKKMLQ